jgi:hypothetical protein
MDSLVAPLVDMNEWEESETFTLDDGPCRPVGIERDLVTSIAQRVGHTDLRVEVPDKWPTGDQKTRH